jgi:hypothetical protein
MGAATGGGGVAYKLWFKQFKNRYRDGSSGFLYWNTDDATVKNNSLLLIFCMYP